MVTQPNVVSALRGKRGELAGQIDALQDQLRAAMIDLDHVDATLRMFDPDIELDEIRPKPLPPRHHAFKGQVTRSILAMLRAEGAMDAKAVAMLGISIELSLRWIGRHPLAGPMPEWALQVPRHDIERWARATFTWFALLSNFC